MSGVTLALDGSTYSATVALLRDGVLVSDARVDSAPSAKPGGESAPARGEGLIPLIAEMLGAHGVTPGEIDMVICGAGPGSFTSLRVAASIGKGIAVASGALMYAVPSLVLTVAGLAGTLEDGSYLSALPAMRGEFFALEISVKGGVPVPPRSAHTILSERALAALSVRLNARLIGPGQEMDAAPEARGVARVFDSIVGGAPVDIHSWEPDYGRLAEAQVKWEAAHGRPLQG